MALAGDETREAKDRCAVVRTTLVKVGDHSPPSRQIAAQRSIERKRFEPHPKHVPGLDVLPYVLCAPPVCTGDPVRTTFVEGGAGCEAFDGDPTGCEHA